MPKQARVAYPDRGSGDVTLLLIHGWQGDRTVWDDVIAQLGPGVRAVAADLPGFGGSKDVPGPYDLDRFAAELRTQIASLGEGPVVLIGHSMGAKVALRVAIDAPNLVRALVLIAPVPAGPAGFSQAGEDYLRATAGHAPRARAWLAKTIEAPHDGATLDRLAAIAANCSRTAVLESLESWMRTDLSEPAAGISAPALVIAPERDQPEKAKTLVAELLPSARYAVLPDAAHYCIVERPAGIAELIREFIGGNDGRE